MCILNPSLPIPSAVAVAVPAAEFTPLALNTSYLNRTAAGAGVRALFNCFKVLIAFHPFLTASQTFYRANVEGIVASLYVDGFSVNEAICNFFSGSD